MGFHPRMKVRNKETGKTAEIVRVEGNHLYVKNKEGNYYHIKTINTTIK